MLRHQVRLPPRQVQTHLEVRQAGTSHRQVPPKAANEGHLRGGDGVVVGLRRQSGRFFIVKDSSLVQVQFITNSTIDSYGGYRGIGNAHIEDFTQMVWWSHTHVGCARVYNPDAILKHDTYVLICNYGGSREANVVGEPVYKKGEPCTECPNNGKCNQSYLKLCGVLEPVPNDTLKSIANAGLAIRNTIPLVLLGPLVLHF
jgi:hypothetical protein